MSDKEKEDFRQNELRREYDNQRAERILMYKATWWPDCFENPIGAIKSEEKNEKFEIIMTDERTDTVKTYDEYAGELTNEDTRQDSIIHESEIWDLSVWEIEDPYEDYNSSVGVSDGYSEADDRWPDTIGAEEKWEYSKASSLDLDDESKNEHWAVYDEDIRTEQDPAYELKQREHRQELRNYRGFDTNFSVGDMIEHHKFWKGAILSIANDVAAIQFKNWGIKKLNIKVAPIRKSVN